MNTQLQFAATGIEPEFKSALKVGLATSFAEIHAAQRLRYEVFAWETGARLHTPFPGLDYDRFDDYCQHLLVWDSATQQVVGCTRLLTDQGACNAGGFYSETEFDLSRVLATSGRFLEIGRTCVHPDYRNGATITALWSGLATLISQHNFDYLIGCASIPLGEGCGEAHAIFAALSQRYLVKEPLRVTPFYPLPCQTALLRSDYTLPPLLKAYLRVGAKIGGEPCLDADFKVADLFILLPTQHLERRYARHFLGHSQ